jgi:hypothetical protein
VRYQHELYVSFALKKGVLGRRPATNPVIRDMTRQSAKGTSTACPRRKKRAVSIKSIKDILKGLDGLGLDHFDNLQDSLDELWDNLDENSVRHANDLAQFPSDQHGCDLFAAIVALAAVIDFLMFSPRKSSGPDDRHQSLRILLELRRNLVALYEGGALPPMFRSRIKGSGRRADVSSILTIKGILAGLMRRQQCAGMSRSEAASWIANNVSPKLAARLSRTAITPRIVSEWSVRYGGEHGENGVARKAYEVWSHDDHRPLTKQKFKMITERLATGDFY